MQKTKKNTLAIMALVILFVSCDKEDVNPIPEVQDTKVIAQAGTWSLTLLEDNGVDKTANFVDYVFTFAETGQLTATNTVTTQTGTWNVRNDRDEDDRMDDVEFIIDFPVPESSIFDDLSDDWDIVSATDTRIELVDLGDANEADDKLILQRN